MSSKDKKPPATERKIRFKAIVAHCHDLAQKYIETWKPLNATWETVEGCAYLRLSTDEQVAVEKGSLEQQVNISIAEALARSSGDQINYKITQFFIEPGVTGRNDNRPEFTRMKHEIEVGKYKFVIFKEIARIAREVTIWKTFFKLCVDRDCRIFIRNFWMNPNDPAQIFQLDILAAFAEYESNQTSRRIRESTFSAMASSGKFNSTKQILGLDQLVVNDEAKVGFYVPNHEELKVVEQIMKTFVLYGSFQRTLEECKRLGIKNKSQKSFNRAALMTLLRNKRYIGLWELNVKNRNRLQKNLLPYERYLEVQLQHGCVIDTGLWNKVQDTLTRIAGSKQKNTNINYTFLLSGILKLAADKSPFHGTGANGNGGRKNYYFNPKHRMRLDTAAVEDEAKRTVSKIIHDSTEFRDAIKRKAVATQSLKQFLESQLRQNLQELKGLDHEKQLIGQRFDYLLKEATDPERDMYQLEYSNELKRILLKAEELKQVQVSAASKLARLQEETANTKALVDMAEEVQGKIRLSDPVALKNAYRELFEAVLVTPAPTDGVIKLNFILRNGQDALITVEEKGSVVDRMVGPAGLEPATRRL
jgi:DNA invertase Pin-like site-specific DNA recombinase